jgi:hypothetical protein
VAGDLLFFDFVRSTIAPQPVAGLILGTMPPQPPALERWNDHVVFLGCPGTYAPGLYQIGQLTIPQIAPGPVAYPTPLAPLSPDHPEEQWEQARYVVLDPACHRTPLGMEGRFRPLAMRGKLRLMVRAD